MRSGRVREHPTATCHKPPAIAIAFASCRGRQSQHGEADIGRGLAGASCAARRGRVCNCALEKAQDHSDKMPSTSAPTTLATSPWDASCQIQRRIAQRLAASVTQCRGSAAGRMANDVVWPDVAPLVRLRPPGLSTLQPSLTIRRERPRRRPFRELPCIGLRGAEIRALTWHPLDRFRQNTLSRQASALKNHRPVRAGVFSLRSGSN